ncbi:unnamed protein product [Fusarium graminearum]|nr:hypothetical protein FG05_05945 [Fusarium graminearum]KAI6751882.1 hypothetical protein HG531_006578 [Fusarium graminearum]CAF3488280.1 unnamed protein product [Fusarium graminearum]CAF3548204.1 unnamed protein product [Fusarium graminearum]CAG1977235.1 unnamed protein product [Fusarium graminearum]
MESLSLAFGVLPVVGEAVKTCRVVRRKLKLFRHYSRELRQVQKRVGRQSQVFSNEIHLLLRPSLQDDDLVEVMLKDQDHPKWTSQDLEDGMRNSLGDNYTSCREIIEDIGSILSSLQSVFDCFDQALDKRDENEHPRDAIRRLREGTKIAYSESKLEQNIKDLNQSLELKNLREQTEQLNKPIDAVSPRRTIRKHTNLEYSNIRNTKESCKALHEAFTIAWAKKTRHGLNHDIQHTVRLFLSTEVQDDVYMNAVITCSPLLNERAIDVRIRSQNHDSILGLPSPASPEASTISSDGQRKRRKVRFTEAIASPPLNPHRPCCVAENSQAVDIPPDLSMADLCTALYKDHILPTNQAAENYCFGYLNGEIDKTFRHHIYANPSLTNRPKITSNTSTGAYPTLVPMSEVLNQPAENSISIIDQLRIAREIVTAVLKLHSSPWLNKYFNLYDLMLYETDGVLTTSLKTVHVASEFTHTILDGQHVTNANLPSPPEADDILEEAKLLYGVRNLTLWSLGTILLQIGRWSTLQCSEDVVAIRKLSSQVTSLGPRYRDLTRKCLNCDFGYGDDLTKPRLQQAVYEGLVYELSEKISNLDVAED